MLEKLRCNWDMPDRYVELLIFQFEVINMLETRVYHINDEKRIPVIKNDYVWRACWSWKLIAKSKRKNTKRQIDCFQ